MSPDRADTISGVAAAQDDPQSIRDRIEAGVDDATATRPLLERLWDLRPGAASAAFVNQHRAALAPLRPLSITLLRSFTIEPVQPILRAAGALHGLDLTVDVGGFGTYAQDLLDPSSAIYGPAAPDIVVLAVQARDIAPDLWASFSDLSAAQVDQAIDRVSAEFTAMVRTFRASSSAHLIVHSLETPGRRSLGIADRISRPGQARTFDELNGRIADLVDATAGVHLLDIDAVVSEVGRRNWHDDRKWVSMKMPIRPEAMPVLVDELMRLIVPISGHVSKALVVDLDNTLWGGVIGEDGIDGIVLGPDSAVGAGYMALQRSLLDLRSRGVLLAIASKNNHDDAMDAIERHPHMIVRPEHFSAVRANWEPKADNLRSIAAELNIGIDSLAFLDDSAAECDQMRRLLPEVTVIELRTPPTPSHDPIARHPRFERTALSDEDRVRAEMYEQQQTRQRQEASSTSLDDYLHALETVVSIAPMAPGDVHRIAQLTQKTNQFNLTTLRYTEADIERFGADDSIDVLAVRAADRFGDHGLIGTAIVRTDGATAVIDTLLLSCRVIGRGVETAMLATIVDAAVAAGCEQVVGRFTPTAKNVPAASFYASHGFEPAGTTDEATVTISTTTTTWRVAASPDAVAVPAWITCLVDHEEITT